MVQARNSVLILLLLLGTSAGQRPPQPPRPPPSPRPPRPPPSPAPSPPPSPNPPSPLPPSPPPPPPRPPPPSPGPPDPPAPPSPPSPPPRPPFLPPAPPRPPLNETVHSFTTSLATYYLYKSRASWTTALEVCRSRSFTLASWPANQELYNIFSSGWEPTYAPEFWVGVVRRANRSVYEFADGGTVPAIDGTPVDEYIQLADPGCTTDVRGCCAALTDRMVGPYAAYATARGPRLVVRSCLTMSMYMCKGPLPPSPPPPSPPYAPLAANVQLRLNMDYVALTVEAGRADAFRADLAAKVAAAFNLQPSQVRVYGLYQDGGDGSTVVQLSLSLPYMINEDAAANYLFRLTASPSIVLDQAFRAAYLISTPIQATLLGVVSLLAPPPAGIAQAAPGERPPPDRSRAGLVGGLVGGLGVAAALAVVAGYVLVRRRRAALRVLQEIH